MATQSQQKQQQLYETDYHLWVLETVKQLQNGDFEAIDWENLIDEVSDLSRREKRRLESLLTRLFEHLLKLKYWDSQREWNQAHWQGEIRNFRIQIRRNLRESPSLKGHLSECFQECYQDACKIVIDKTRLSPDTFPEEPIAPLEQVLDENWLP
jgi:cytochrome b involved in lipid metabolism